MKKPTHILVIRLSAMGDVAMTVPVLRVVAKTYPELQLTVLSKEFFKPLFEDIPNVQFLPALVTTKHKDFGLYSLVEEANALGIDAIADLHNVLRSKVIRNICGIKNGVVSSKIDKGRTKKKRLTAPYPKKQLQPLKTTHQRYVDVFANLGFPISLDAPTFPPAKELAPKLHDFIGKHTRKLIGIAPFAAHEGKMYPLTMMSRVIEDLLEEGRYELFLFGGKNEVSQLKKLGNGREQIKIVAGNFSFEEELALISNLDGMLAMDSGNGHLAAMFGVPVITLWGVTHPYLGFTPFKQPRTQQLVANRERYPLIPTSVYGNRHPSDYKDCMKSIPIELVVSKIIQTF